LVAGAQAYRGGNFFWQHRHGEQPDETARSATVHTSAFIEGFCIRVQAAGFDGVLSLPDAQQLHLLI
jgi:hypothetical protein